MEPIPESLAAINELDEFVVDQDLLADLQARAARVREVAPECVGFSLATAASGITLTLVATSEEVAALDAVQYLAGGPCVDAVEKDQPIESHPGSPLSEDRWRLFSQASAAAGIRSTLTLPLLVDGHATGSVNMYGRTPDAFAGKFDELAEVFGAWAGGAVTNADLMFTTRREAERAPAQLRDQAQLDAATGILAATHGLDLEAAWAELREAAERARVSVVRLANIIIELYATR